MTDGNFAQGLVGVTLDGRYRLDAVLGEGGMGSVFRATQLAMDRKVAVKLLKPHLTNDEAALQRFAREARATLKVDSPHAVKILDFGVTPLRDYYMVLEYLDGRTVQRELEIDGPFAPARVAHIARQALHALGAAHGQGLIHRDVKPDNLLLMRVGGDADYTKILDFGVAKLMQGAAGDPSQLALTAAGMVFGTPEFMSPEQACGHALDGRSDLYSLAVTMFVMLTGTGLFEGKTAIEWLTHHARTPAPRLAMVRPELAAYPELDDLLQRCLTKHREQRPETAAAMAALIAEIEPTLARTPASAAAPQLAAGHATGQVAGHATGHAVGHASGGAAGNADGGAAGNASGGAAGNADGHASGHAVGHASGHAGGNATGSAIGQAVGHASGHAGGNATGSAIGRAVTPALSRTATFHESSYFHALREGDLGGATSASGHSAETIEVRPAASRSRRGLYLWLGGVAIASLIGITIGVAIRRSASQGAALSEARTLEGLREGSANARGPDDLAAAAVRVDAGLRDAPISPPVDAPALGHGVDAAPMSPVGPPAAPVRPPAAPVRSPAAPVRSPAAPVRSPAAPVGSPAAPVGPPAGALRVAAPPRNPAAEEHLQNAEGALAQDAQLRQLAEADLALQANPRSVRAKFLLGDAQVKLGDHDRGCANLRAIRRYPPARDRARAAGCPGD